MAQRIRNQALIDVAGSHVAEKWTSARIGFIYKATTKHTYGIPIIAQYNGVISHEYYGVCNDYLLRAASIVCDSIEDILGMRCEAEGCEEPNSPKYIVTAARNGEVVIELHFDVLKVGGLVYNIDVLAAYGHEDEAQELTGIAMSALDKTTKDLSVKPFH